MTPDVPESLLSRLSFLLGRLYFQALDLEGPVLAELGLDVKAQAVLTVLAEEKPMTQQALGQRLGIDRTTIVTVVDRLEQHGFVERRRSPADRRAYLLTPTAKGDEARQRGARAVNTAERKLLDALDDAERDRLTDLLGQALKGQPSVP